MDAFEPMVFKILEMGTIFGGDVKNDYIDGLCDVLQGMKEK